MELATFHIDPTDWEQFKANAATQNRTGSAQLRQLISEFNAKCQQQDAKTKTSSRK